MNLTNKSEGKKYSDIVLSRSGSVGILTLNCPEKLNPLTPAMRSEMPEAISEIARDDEIRVLVITGAGRAFCSGGDVSEVVTTIEKGGSVARELVQSPIEPIAAWAADIFYLEKPVIAAVNGPAAGAGVGLGLLCDIVIASEKATFSLAFVNRGVIPDVGLTYTLPRAVGRTKALELMFTGKRIDAGEAQRIGLVNEVIAHDGFMSSVMEVANQLADAPPVAVQMMKRLVLSGLGREIERQILLENYGLHVCFSTADFKEGFQSFFEKRQPHFRGL